MNRNYEILRPLCWLCKKPVEEFEVYFSDFEDIRKFRVKCHGQEQVVKLDGLTFACGDIRPGFAFFNHNLEEQKKIK